MHPRGILDLTPTYGMLMSKCHKQTINFLEYSGRHSLHAEFSRRTQLGSYLQSQRFGEWARSANHQSQTFQGQRYQLCPKQWPAISCHNVGRSCLAKSQKPMYGKAVRFPDCRKLTKPEIDQRLTRNCVAPKIAQTKTQCGKCAGRDVIYRARANCNN